MKRVFMLPGAKPINDRIHHIEFGFGEGENAVTTRRGIKHDGSVAVHCPWSFKDVMSHVESGTMIEVLQEPDNENAYFEPSEYQLKMAAGARVRLPDVPQTEVEGGAW